ncbi:ATP-dependent RNA-DNA and DNA-DNA helicase protein [Rhizobium phage RHph_TM16]|nr:ATP-dependent RNA-DNA and DNA-DNA helicase protein [Rhizobium phage RHph_TM16]
MSTGIAKYMMTEQPLETGKMAKYPYSYALERKFRFMTRFDDLVNLYQRDGDYIYLPRGVCPIGENDNRVEGADVHFPKKPQPRPHQVKMFKDVEEFIGQKLSGVAVAYTGFGKTLLGFLAAWKLQKKTLVITTKEDIYEQWIKGAHEFLGVPKWRIGNIRGDKCEVIDTDFCVALVQSLCKEGKYPDWIGDDFGLIIFDECQRMPADYFQNVVTMFPAKVRLALSATPDRKDGKEIMIYTNVGPIRAAAEAELMIPKVLRYQTAWECPMRWVTDPVLKTKQLKKIPHTAGKTAHIETFLMNDQIRNKQIVQCIVEAYEAKRSHVIFSNRLEHLDMMLEACNKLHKIPYKDLGVYKSASTKEEKADRERVKVKPIIFTTYSMMNEGTSIDWLDTCTFAMPRSDVRQATGRIRREWEGKKFPVVFDFMDLDSPVFFGYANKRRDWYKQIGAEIVEMA